MSSEPIIEEPDTDAEEITVTREELKKYNTEQNDEQDEHIYVRRVIIAPMGGLLGSIHVNPLIPHLISQIVEEQTSDKPPMTHKNNESVTAHKNNDKPMQKPTQNNESATIHKTNAEPTMTQKNSDKKTRHHKKRTTVSGGSKKPNNEEDLLQSVLFRCYSFVSVLVVLIVLTIMTSRRLYREYTVYQNIKTGIIA